MSDQGSDAQAVVGLGHVAETGDAAQVDDHRRLGRPDSEERKQAVPAGEDQRLAGALLEDPERRPEVSGPQ